MVFRKKLKIVCQIQWQLFQSPHFYLFLSNCLTHGNYFIFKKLPSSNPQGELVNQNGNLNLISSSYRLQVM